jgi:hypothetical protein
LKFIAMGKDIVPIEGVGKHDEEITAIFEALGELTSPPKKPRREIEFYVREDSARYRTRKRA